MTCTRTRLVVGLGFAVGLGLALLACKSNNIDSTTGSSSNCATASDCTNGEVCGHDQVCHPACEDGGACPDKTNICTDGVCYPAEQEASTCMPSPGSGTGTLTGVSGTYQGGAIPQKDVVASLTTSGESFNVQGTTAYGNYLLIALTSYANACGGRRRGSSSLASKSWPSPSTTTRRRRRDRCSWQARTTLAGEAGLNATAILIGEAAAASTCAATNAEDGGLQVVGVQSGTITLSVVSMTEVAGSFDLTVPSTGEHIAGTFDTFPCAIPGGSTLCCTP